MATRRQIVLGACAAALVVGAPLVYSSNRSVTIRNFRVVEDGVLYRSGQLTPEVLERIVRERGIKTVISLRGSRVKGTPEPDAWEEALCADRGLKHVRITPRVWTPDNRGYIPAEENIREFLAVLDRKENYPVLVHCFAGIHRTGTMCAIFRMEFHRWPAERAIAEMQAIGFDPADMQENIEGYLRAYRPRWMKSPE